MFYIIDQLENHLTDDHPQMDQWRCKECHCTVQRTNYRKHLPVHGIAMYQCLYCLLHSDDLSVMENHISDRHPNNGPYYCARMLRVEQVLKFIPNLNTIQYSNELFHFECRVQMSIQVQSKQRI